MPFKIGDSVIHPLYGIGYLVSIEEKEFSEKKICLYYKIALSKRTVWIPVETQEASGLRLVTAEHDLDQYRDLLKSPPVPLEKKHQQRHLDLTSRLKQNSFRVLCEVVRDLTAWSWGKPLGQVDTITLKKTRESLYREWATAAGVSTTEAIKEIDSLLLATKPAYQG